MFPTPANHQTLFACTFAVALLAAACTDDSAGDGDDSAGTEGADVDTDDGTEAGETGMEQTGIPVLGNGSHDLGEVVVEIIGTPADGLSFPTDAEFKPGTQQLWVTNRDDFSIVVFDDAGLPSQASAKFQDGIENGWHFLAKPAALAFGAEGTFATAQQENEVTQPGDPADGSFMGPTLWTSDLAVFDGGHWSHLDMLHNSPLSSGIAWDSENSYWVYDGRHGSLTYYKFNDDHGLGGTDHTDGEVLRYADGQLGYVHSIPSHIAWDREGAMLYAADTQNKRIVRLDAATGSMGGSIQPNYDGGSQRYMMDSELVDLIDGASLEAPMMGPSGLELYDDKIWVSDPFAGVIYAFDMDGNLLDWLETGWPAGSLLGFTFDNEGSIYVADAAANQVVKISAP